MFNNINFEKEQEFYSNTINSIKKFINEGGYKYAISDAREFLEHYLKLFSEELNLQTSSDNSTIKSEDMIDSLLSVNFFNEKESSVFHKLRKSSNKGAHSAYFNPTKEDAENALYYIRESFKIVKNKISNNNYSDDYKVNTPVSGADYYSKNRRTYGKWQNCYSRNDLESIPEYVELRQKADEGDIDAMLNIAIGFLTSKINWNDNELINMPPYNYRGKAYYQDYSYDTRYYYWIGKACKTAIEKDKNNEFYSKRYIATALLEFIKFKVYTIAEVKCYCTGINDVYDQQTHQYTHHMIYSNQYELIKKIYGNSEVFNTNIYSLYQLLYKILSENNFDFTIISPVHLESNLKQIKFLIYCCSYYYQTDNPDDNESYLLFDNYLISEEDENIPITKEILLKYIDDDACKRNFDYIEEYVNKIRRKKYVEKEYARINRKSSIKDEAAYRKKVKKVVLVVAAIVLSIYTIMFFNHKSKENTFTPVTSVEQVQNANFDYVLKILNDNGINPDKCYFEEGVYLFGGENYINIVFFENEETYCTMYTFYDYYIDSHNFLYVEYDEYDLQPHTYNSIEGYIQTGKELSNATFVEIELK